MGRHDQVLHRLNGLTVEGSIQGDKIRVTGKSRDDLQGAIAMLKPLKGLEVALQLNNFRD